MSRQSKWEEPVYLNSPRNISALILLFALTLPVAYSQTVQKISPPGTTYAFALGINNSGSRVVGSFQDSSGAFEGFIYNGRSYKALVAPNSNAMTRANGVNKSNLVVGDFRGTDGFNHGYFYSQGKFTQFDIGGNIRSTYINGINDVGNFSGQADDPNINAFVSIDGVVTVFTVSGNQSVAFGINNSNTAVGTFYPPPFTVYHGFSRAADGTITQIDFPGSTSTSCLGINDSGQITGFYLDSAGIVHGFTLLNGHYKSSSLPDIAGINNSGSYVGSLTALSGQNYGYIVRH